MRIGEEIADLAARADDLHGGKDVIGAQLGEEGVAALVVKLGRLEAAASRRGQQAQLAPVRVAPMQVAPSYS